MRPVRAVDAIRQAAKDVKLPASVTLTFLGASGAYESSRMRFSRTPAVVRWPGPQIGEHNDYVLRELLGLSDREIAELKSREALA